MFRIHSSYEPAGDQPKAIEDLTSGYQENHQQQVLLGVTGSGKTFTVANVIQNIQKPTLVIAHNKTLAAQLYQEFRDFFPENAVSYFVSYYDYYQPEAYIATTDTYIEKEATINDEIDKLRLAATADLLSRPDCIVVASVSCIYGLGRPEDFALHTLEIVEGELLARKTLITRLIDMQYDRSDDLARGTFRERGDRIQVWPANESYAITITLPDKKIEKLEIIDPTSGELWPEVTPGYFESRKRILIFPRKHYMSGQQGTEATLKEIENDMRARVKDLKSRKKIVEAYRLEQRTLHDIDMIRELGFVNGIENYSRYFDHRQPGEPPFTLLDYFRHNAETFGDGKFLTVVDESHITLSQIGGMYFGDRSRKETLIEYGFRLPAAIDNRPLQFPEFLDRINLAMYVSATPRVQELELAQGKVVEQIVRPTGLVDPPIEVRPIEGQIRNLAEEIIKRKATGQRVLVTTLTKRMAETLTEYLNDPKKIRALLPAGTPTTVELPKVQYLHSDVETLERSGILDQLRRGEFDVLVGINLLREGLDLPEVSLVAILDADQEGFLRSAPSLIQIMGRAARHVDGAVILYADRITGSMKQAMDEVARRREIQLQYNEDHGITPLSISKPIRDQLIQTVAEDDSQPGVHHLTKNQTPHKTNKTALQINKSTSIILEDLDPAAYTPAQKQKIAKQLTRAMNNAAKNWQFELAARIRDTIAQIEN